MSEILPRMARFTSADAGREPGGWGAALRPGVPAVLLANHGVLVFHRTPELAVLVGGVVEEAAQAAINASGLGGPVAIPADLRAAALQRAMAFDAAGTKTA